MSQLHITSNMIVDNLWPVLTLGFAGFASATIITPIYTTLAFKGQWWKKPRSDTVSGEKAAVFTKIHAKKHARNIPTMAGGIFLLALCLVTVVSNFDRGQTWLPLAAAVGAGLIGLLDDVINLKGNGIGTAGLNFKIKLLLTSMIAAAVSYWFVYKLGYDSLHMPFIGSVDIIAPLLFGLFVFVIIAMANAVNITDGLDGLAGGLSLSAFGAFALIAFLQGNFGLAGFCLTLVGTLLSFLWFNIYPARFFMGDIGSFALGTTMAVVAIMSDSVMLLPVIGIIFVIEVASSALQIFSKKVFKKKIFLSAPIHHHFEAIGWPETKVTMRAWVLGQIAAVLGLLLAVLGGHILL